MEPNSQTSKRCQTANVLEAQIRECYGRVVYSHKTHEKCSDILLSRLAKIKLWQIILSAITTAGFIIVLFGDNKWTALIGAIISTALLILNTYTKNYDLGELAQKHKQAANDLWLIREKYLSLLVDIAVNQKSSEELQKKRDSLLEELHQIYSGAPSTNFKAYKKAQEALQKLEDLTFSDEEIDAFLPKELKRNKHFN